MPSCPINLIPRQIDRMLQELNEGLSSFKNLIGRSYLFEQAQMRYLQILNKRSSTPGLSSRRRPSKNCHPDIRPTYPLAKY